MAKRPPRPSAESGPEEPIEDSSDTLRESDPAGGSDRDWRAAFSKERESLKRIRTENEELRAKLAKSENDFEELRESTTSARLLGELAKRGLTLTKPDAYLPVLRAAIEEAHPGTDFAKVPEPFFARFREEHSGLFAGSAKSGSGAGAGAASTKELTDSILLRK